MNATSRPSYYVVAVTYEGPDAMAHFDQDTVEVYDYPPSIPYTDVDPEDGSFPSITAHNWRYAPVGKFATLAEAQDAAQSAANGMSVFPNSGWRDEAHPEHGGYPLSEDSSSPYEYSPVYAVKPGHLHPMHPAVVADWVYEEVNRRVTLATTADDAAVLVNEWQGVAWADGWYAAARDLQAAIDKHLEYLSDGLEAETNSNFSGMLDD